MSDEETRSASQRFFKSPLKCYGLRNPAVHSLARSFYKKFEAPQKEDIFKACESLLRSGYNEEALIACDWTYFMRKQYAPGDLDTFERWIRDYISNWASCDTFCNHSVGTLLEKFPELAPRLKEWAVSDRLWLRRAAAVSLILPARKGTFLAEILQICRLLLEDKEDMVQKGYGWLLKEASKNKQQEIFTFVMRHKGKMPRTALRYAVEKMPAELRTAAMLVK